LSLPFYIAGKGVGTGLTMGDHSVLGPSFRLWVDSGATIRIGANCYLNGMTTLAAAQSIEIDDCVLIAWNVQVIDNQHRTTDRSRPIIEQGIDRVAPVRIRGGAWLGANVVVMPGVTVGRNAVVGANSVVTRDVRDFATVAGAPAHVI